MKSGGDFTDAQPVSEVIENHAVRRIKPLVNGPENVTGRHLGEHRRFSIRISQQFVETAALTGIVFLQFHQANPALAVFQRINAAPLAEEVAEVKLAALEIPTRTLSGAPVVELPQMNHRFLQEIFLKASIGSYRGHDPKQRGVGFWQLKIARTTVDNLSRLVRGLMGPESPGHAIFHLIMVYHFA